jgi:hypothetical protein
MATILLATGTTSASSADVTVVANVPQTIFLVDADAPTITQGAFVAIQIKDSTGAYFTVDRLDYQQIARVLDGPGVFRVTRSAGVSCGVNLNAT